MNFAGCSPFVPGFAHIRMTGDLLPAMLLRTLTEASRQRKVVSSADRLEGQSAAFVCAKGGLGDVLGARWVRGSRRLVVRGRLTKSMGDEEASSAEEHGCTDHDFNRGVITAQQTSVVALHTDGRELRVRLRQITETVRYASRTSRV